MNFNTWLVTSTINTKFSVWSPKQRLDQTVNTLKSIKDKDPTSKIIFVDNSIDPLNTTQRNQLQPFVTLFHQCKHNVFSIVCNTTDFNKGAGEILMTEVGLDLAQTNNLMGKRLFKMCGRYILSYKFDVSVYETPLWHEKYVYKNTYWEYESQNEKTVKQFLETKLWSMCNTLVPEYKSLLPAILEYMLRNKENIEVATNALLPMEKRAIVDSLHVYGWYATGLYVEA
jgi:hypothetical protein